MSDPTYAGAVLRALLPPELLARLELARLTVLSGVLIGTSMAKAEVDVLLAVPLRDTSSFIYVLVEHQSRPDKTMPTRMLGYVLRIWEQHQRTHGEDPLPPVFPLVVHHDARRGSASWAGPTKVPVNALGGTVPQFGFLLDDLVVVSEDELWSRGLPGAVLLALFLFKNASRNGLTVATLERRIELLQTVLADTRYRNLFLTYIQSAGEAHPGELRKLFAGLGSDIEEAFVTTADMLIAEGKAEGIAEGKAEGIAEGKAEGIAQSLLHVLARRQLPVGAADRERIMACTDPAVLDRWLDRAIGATTVQELFV